MKYKNVWKAFTESHVRPFDYFEPCYCTIVQKADIIKGELVTQIEFLILTNKFFSIYFYLDLFFHIKCAHVIDMIEKLTD